MIPNRPPLCEVERRTGPTGSELHPCRKAAGHAGEHVCALYEICGVTWSGTFEVVHADHLGPCAECSGIVRAGRECSECLEEDGVAVHDGCCPENVQEDL
jgi:hypothetical protein